MTKKQGGLGFRAWTPIVPWVLETPQSLSSWGLCKVHLQFSELSSPISEAAGASACLRRLLREFDEIMYAVDLDCHLACGCARKCEPTYLL